MSADKNEKVKVDIIGFSSRAPGGFRAALDLFSTYLPQHDIDVCTFGYTRGNPRGMAPYVPILTWVPANPFLRAFALFFRAPFLPLRSRSVIMTAYSVEQIPFIVFHPRHPKVFRVAQHTDAIGINQPRLVMSLYRGIERFCARFMQGFIALDEATKTYLMQKCHVPESKIRVIPVAVDPDMFRPMDRTQARTKMRLPLDKAIVLYVGKMTPVKNIPMLLGAFQELHSARPDTMLLLAGTGPYEREYQRMVEERGISGVCFLGYVDRNEVPVLMNCADVLALSSLSEVSPNVIREAIACGLPVVSTRVGDVPDYVTDDFNGYIVETDPHSFAEGLIKAIQNEERLRQGALETRKKFDPDRIMQEYARVFRGLYQRKRE